MRVAYLKVLLWLEKSWWVWWRLGRPVRRFCRRFRNCGHPCCVNRPKGVTHPDAMCTTLSNFWPCAKSRITVAASLPCPQASHLCSLWVDDYAPETALSSGLFFAPKGGLPVDEGSLNLNALLTATEAAEYAGVSVNVIVNWRARGHLPVARDENGAEIRDKQGRPRYRLLDVAKAENATKQRGERMARGITRRDPQQRLAA